MVCLSVRRSGLRHGFRVEVRAGGLGGVCFVNPEFNTFEKVLPLANTPAISK